MQAELVGELTNDSFHGAPGDANEILKEAQHSAYWDIVGHLFANSRLVCKNIKPHLGVMPDSLARLANR